MVLCFQHPCEVVKGFMIQVSFSELQQLLLLNAVGAVGHSAFLKIRPISVVPNLKIFSHFLKSLLLELCGYVRISASVCGR